jgi:hypothetical protein
MKHNVTHFKSPQIALNAGFGDFQVRSAQQPRGDPKVPVQLHG